MANQKPTGNSLSSAFRKRPDVSVSAVAEETLLLDISGGSIHHLNPTASFIWQHCDQASSEEDLAQRIVQHFDVDEVTARRDVKQVLTHFRSLQLLVD